MYVKSDDVPALRSEVSCADPWLVVPARTRFSMQVETSSLTSTQEHCDADRTWDNVGQKRVVAEHANEQRYQDGPGSVRLWFTHGVVQAIPVPVSVPGEAALTSHPWTNTSVGETLEELSGPLVHTNFPRKRYGPMIGPYEFPYRNSYGPIIGPKFSESFSLDRYWSI